MPNSETKSKSRIAPNYEVVFAQRGIYSGDIRNLLSKTSAEATEEDRLSNYYDANPKGSPAVFLLKSIAESKFVGILCATPRQFLLRGVPLTGYVFSDFYVEPEHRTLGPSSILLREARSKLLSRSDFIYGFMNIQAKVIGLRINLPFIHRLSQLVLPLSFVYHFRKRYSGYFGAIMGNLLGAGFFFTLFLTNCASRLYYSVREQDPSDADLTKLISCKRFSASLVGARDNEFYNWRFGKIRNNSMSRIAVYTRTGRLAAFAIYSISKNNRVIIQDVMSEDNWSLATLVTSIIRKMKNTDYLSVQSRLLLDVSENRLLRKLGFQQDGAGLDVFLDWAENRDERLGPVPVYFTPADNDI